jgi:drug/metabolite transporter (DMT)-like permease
MERSHPVVGRSHREIAVSLGLAVVAISFAAPFFKLANAPPLMASAIRLVIASVLLAIPAWRARRAGKLDGQVVRAAALAGVFYGVHFGAWVTSLGLTSVAASVTLVTATPVMLGVIAIATGRDRPTRRHWLSIGLALIGVLIIGGHDFGLSGDALLGDGLALLGAAAMAGYFLSARSVMQRADPWGFSFVACAVGAIVLLLGVVVTGADLALPPAEAIGWLALAALVPQIIGHGLMTRALRDARPTVVGMVTVGEPVGATLLAWAFLGEGITLITAIGCAVTATAVALAAAARE